MITLDTTSQFTGSGGSSQTVSHTVGAGSNILLVVAVGGWDASHTNSVVNSITYNGVALTNACANTQVDGGGCNVSEVWYLVNPATGAHDVVVTFNNSMGGIYGSIASVFGAKQSAQPDAQTTQAAAASASPFSTSITTVANNSWIFDMLSNSGITITGAGASQTQIQTGVSSYKSNVSTGSNSMSWTYTGSGKGCHAVASFSPVPPVAVGNIFQIF